MCQSMEGGTFLDCAIAHVTGLRPGVGASVENIGYTAFMEAMGILTPYLHLRKMIRVTYKAHAWVRRSPRALSLVLSDRWTVAPTEFPKELVEGFLFPVEYMPPPEQLANFIFSCVGHGSPGQGRCGRAALLLWALGARSEDMIDPEAHIAALRHGIEELQKGKHGVWLHALEVSGSVQGSVATELTVCAHNPLAPMSARALSAYRGLPEVAFVRAKREPVCGQVQRTPPPAFLFRTLQEKLSFIQGAYNYTGDGNLAEFRHAHALLVGAGVSAAQRRELATPFRQPLRGLHWRNWPKWGTDGRQIQETAGE
jgi:hypothetical protein